MDNNEIKTNPVEGKKSKKKLFIILGSILGAGAIAGASVGIYFATRPKAKNYFYFKNVGEIDATLTTVLMTEKTDPTTIFPNLYYSNNPNKDLDQWEKLPLGDKEDPGYFFTLNLNPGDTIYFYGNNPNGINKSTGEDQDTFIFMGSQDKGTAEKLAVGGNISSLVYGKDFESKNEVPCDFCYSNLFMNNYSIVTAKDLILPTEDLKSQCFYRMFYECSNLECAPYLGASSDKVINAYCYHALFEKCAKIREIKVNFGLNNEWPGVGGDSATKDWLDGEAGKSAEDPTFYWRGDNNPSIDERSGDYVPEGWTILHWE